MFLPTALRPKRLPPLLAALRHSNYRLYFFGQLISWTGTWMHTVALGWLVLRLSGSAFMLGLVSAVGSLAVIALSIPAGILVDRISKRTLLLLTQIGSMVIVFGLGIATIIGAVSVWGIVAASFLLGVMSAFDAPTRHSFLIDLTAREDLLNAIALSSGLWHITRFLGPAIAGVIIAHHGEGVIFLVNALSFLAIIYSVIRMRVPGRVSSKDSNLLGLRESLEFMRSQRSIRALLVLAAGVAFFGFAYIPILPLFVKEVLHRDVVSLGILMSVGGVGALIAAFLIAGFSAKLRRGRLLVLSAVSFPLTLCAFAAAPSLEFAALFAALASWGGVSTMILVNGLIQSVTPDHLRGRVLSFYTLALLGIGPLGGVVLGGAIELAGQIRLMVGGTALVTAIVVAAALRMIHNDLLLWDAA